MMNYPTIAARSGYLPADRALHGEGISPGGVGAVSASSPVRAASIEVDDGQWLIAWPADDASPAAPPNAGAAGYRLNAGQPQSTGEAADLARRYTDEVKAGAVALDELLYQLLDGMYSEAGVTMKVQDPDRLLPAEFGAPEKLQEWIHATRNGLVALHSAFEEMSAASRAPVAVDRAAAAGRSGVGNAVRGAPTTGPLSLCLTTLHRYPELATNEERLYFLKDTLVRLKGGLEFLQYRLDWQKGRHDVEARMTTVQYARTQKLRSLRLEAESVSRAGEASMLVRDSKVGLGDGNMRTPVLGLAARTKAAFGAFFTRVGAALGRGASALFTLIADYGRHAARLQEHKDAQTTATALSALQSIAPDSLLHSQLGFEVGALLGAVKAGVVDMEYPEVRQQFVMGENLVRLLITDKMASFGSLAYPGEKGHRDIQIVPSTLTTARAIAWYLDTVADMDDDARRQSPGTPEVRRKGNSLIVADPQRRLAGFLISAPTAYTAAMAGHDDATLSSAITIDDHRPGMPGGMRAMHFETVVDEKSKAVGLRLSFTERSARPVYQPLANEREVLDRMKAAQHRASAALPAARQDYSGWSVDRLRAHFQALQEQALREIAVFKADQRLLQDMGAQDNPLLITNFA